MTRDLWPVSWGHVRRNWRPVVSILVTCAVSECLTLRSECKGVSRPLSMSVGRKTSQCSSLTGRKGPWVGWKAPSQTRGRLISSKGLCAGQRGPWPDRKGPSVDQKAPWTCQIAPRQYGGSRHFPPFYWALQTLGNGHFQLSEWGRSTLGDGAVQRSGMAIWRCPLPLWAKSWLRAW